ncbi:hypothetical protein HG530_004585 [Fusarium avenaceum]|nr:hypothetical protein HG530_004585 [Fusarium avenaceum]
MNHASNQSSPSTLVGSAQTAATVAIKELVEPKVIFPVFVKVEAIITTIDATSSVIGTGEKMLQAVLDFFRHLAQMHVVTATGRALDLEVWSIEEEESL